jgi:hypothetical protein
LIVKLQSSAAFGAVAGTLRFGLLCALYTLALLSIVVALRAQEQQTGAFQINFEYRAF